MKRFIFSDNATLLDYSTELENYHSGTATINLVSANDAIFIGSELPFNSLFFKFSTPNAQASVPTIQYWDGQQFRSVVEIIDETDASGASFGQDGHITWTTDKNYGWAKDDTVDANGNVEVTGLANVTIYDLYWLKLTFSADFDAGTIVSWIGPKFCSSDDVENEYRLLSNSTFKTNYEAGKTGWDKEIVLASRLIVEDLIDKAVIMSGDQLLERRKLRDACVSKVAQLVFKSLGDDYKDDFESAQKEYYSRLNKKNYRADLNENARIDENEKGVVTGGLYR